MIKNSTFLLSLFASVLLSFGAKQKEPEIRKEMRGKTEYMFINGIKVHEIDPKKQPQPKIVKPKPYDAKAAKPPKEPRFFWTAPRRPCRTGWRETGSPPSGSWWTDPSSPFAGEVI